MSLRCVGADCASVDLLVCPAVIHAMDQLIIFLCSVPHLLMMKN